MSHQIIKLSNSQDLIDYLNEVDCDFGIPLSHKVSIASFANKLLANGNVYVVRYNNKCVACIGFYCNDIVNRIAYCQILSTKTIVRGKGFARQLINVMIDKCRQSGMKQILVDSINPTAIALYKSIGFMEYDKDGNKSFLKYIIY